MDILRWSTVLGALYLGMTVGCIVKLREHRFGLRAWLMLPFYMLLWPLSPVFTVYHLYQARRGRPRMQILYWLAVVNYTLDTFPTFVFILASILDEREHSQTAWNRYANMIHKIIATELPRTLH